MTRKTFFDRMFNAWLHVQMWFLGFGISIMSFLTDQAFAKDPFPVTPTTGTDIISTVTSNNSRIFQAIALGIGVLLCVYAVIQLLNILKWEERHQDGSGNKLVAILFLVLVVGLGFLLLKYAFAGATATVPAG